MMYTCHYISVQIYKYTKSSMNHKVKYDTMCQGRFINCNKYTTLVKDVDNEEGYAFVQGGVMRKLYTFLSMLL